MTCASSPRTWASSWPARWRRSDLPCGWAVGHRPAAHLCEGVKMHSAFGVDHGEISKAGPFGAGMYKLGQKVGGKAGSAVHRAGAAQQARHLDTGKVSGTESLITHQNMKPRGT